MLKQFFGWLFMTQAYLDTLTDEELLLRACSSKRQAYAAGFQARKLFESQERLNRLLDKINADIIAFPFTSAQCVVFSPPPPSTPKSAEEVREQGRAYDVSYKVGK